jgi:hypothetical protein
MVECQSLPIAQIYVPVKRRGTLKSDLVREIAESILEIGQQAPILVRRDGQRFVLLDGLHRLEACKALGEDNILGILASELGHPKVLPSYETEIDILRQKTNRLRELRLAKEAAERQSPVASAASETPTAHTREGARRVRESSSRSRVSTLVEWLAERKNDGSRF